ncbi:prealbumin-like fold domain-containing protein [Microbacterium sp. NPDC055903]
MELLDGVRVPGGGWTFDLDAEGVEFAAGDSLTTGDDGMASTVVTAPNRPYELTISEQDEAGWTLDSVTCTVAGAAVDVDQTATITLSGVAAGADVHCTFVNTDDPEVPGVPEGPDDNEDGGADPGQDPDDDAQGELGVTGAEPAIGAALLGVALLLGGATIVTARRRHS